MDNRSKQIWFWFKFANPHIAGLAAALADRGYSVIFVTEESIPLERVELGWVVPDLGDARLIYAPTKAETIKLASQAPKDSVHICHGIRANGLIQYAQKTFAQNGISHWALMEKANDLGWRGVLKRIVYRRLFFLWKHRISGVLAIGYRTPNWLKQQGFSEEKIFPFAYFLPESINKQKPDVGREGLFRFVFVGRFIELKCVGLLISSLARANLDNFELMVVGSGPLEDELKLAAETILGRDRLRWVGRVLMTEVAQLVEQADCLVLPSIHDGWGAVVSEALMVGTPVICSDACGSAEVVKASGVGGVFRSGDESELTCLLRDMVKKGRQSGRERARLAEWGTKNLGVNAGADYLVEILNHGSSSVAKPPLPWCRY